MYFSDYFFQIYAKCHIIIDRINLEFDSFGKNMLLRKLFNTPRSTPIDSEMLTSKYRIIQNKLNLLFHISRLEKNTLARLIFENQKEYKFPGLVTEMKHWIHSLNLPDIINSRAKISKKQFKNSVYKAIKDKCEDELKQGILTSKKLKDGPLKNEQFEKKTYLTEFPLNNVRQNFKFRTGMFDAKFNYKHDPKYADELWKCSSCLTQIDTQSHVLMNH